MQSANPSLLTRGLTFLKKVWNAFTFENLREVYSFATNLTAIGSSVAPLLPDPLKKAVAPALGAVSYTTLQAVYRADNDKLRSKIARHKQQYLILQGLMPAAERNRQQFQVVPAEVSLDKFGAKPYSCKGWVSTLSGIAGALAAGGLASYIVTEGLDKWNTREAKGLGSTAVILLVASSATGVLEEHQKKKNLEKLDDAYKDKITAMKGYFIQRRSRRALSNYSAQSQALPRSLRLS